MERASTGACTQVHFNLGLGARLRLREPGESARAPGRIWMATPWSGANEREMDSGETKGARGGAGTVS